jgi:hypothetical protein
MPQTTKKGYFAIAYIKEDQSWQKEGELYDAIVAVFNASPIWNNNCEQAYATHDEITERIKEREKNADLLIAIWVALVC